MSEIIDSERIRADNLLCVTSEATSLLVYRSDRRMSVEGVKGRTYQFPEFASNMRIYCILK